MATNRYKLNACPIAASPTTGEFPSTTPAVLLDGATLTTINAAAPGWSAASRTGAGSSFAFSKFQESGTLLVNFAAASLTVSTLADISPTLAIGDHVLVQSGQAGVLHGYWINATLQEVPVP